MGVSFRSLLAFKRFASDTFTASRSYIVKRFARLAPIYYISLLFSVIFIYHPAWKSEGYWQITILVPAFWFWDPAVYRWNPPLWFVSQLFLFYFFVPVLMLCLRNLGRRALAAISAGAAVIPFVAFCVYYFHINPLISWTANHGKSGLDYERWLSFAPYLNFCVFTTGFCLGLLAKKFSWKRSNISSFCVDIISAAFVGNVILTGFLATKNATRYNTWMLWDRFAGFLLYAVWIFLL